MKNFWKDLKKPFFVLAPMHDVTDTAFRRVFVFIDNILKEEGKRKKPDVMFTEFVSVDGLLHKHSRERIIKRYLTYNDSERPIVAQIWGRDYLKFKEAAKIIADLGFDGIDINMGCPVKKIIKMKACSYLINEPELAQKIIKYTKLGAKSLPVSVKTRLGYDKNVSIDWIKYLVDEGLSAITIHGRIAKHMSKYPADWESIGGVADYIHSRYPDILVIGNGDIKSIPEGVEVYKKYSVDGVMIGRGALKNRWVFTGVSDIKDIPLDVKMKTIIYHSYLFEKEYKGMRSLSTIRKNFKSYLSSIKDSKEMKLKLFDVKTAKEVEEIVKMWYNKNTGNNLTVNF